jgi:hypothetical protein
MYLVLLVEHCIIYAGGRKLRSSHLSSLRVKFLVTRLIDKKNIIKIVPE